MGLASLAIDILLIGYVFFSWTTIGYVFLRTGWPKIRLLEKESRLGWALLLTVTLNLVMIISAFLFSVLLPFASFRTYLLMTLVAFSFIGMAVLTVKRKVSSRRRVTVSVPASVVGAKIASDNAMAKFAQRPGHIVVSAKGSSKIDELKKSLAKTKTVQKPAPPKPALTKTVSSKSGIEFAIPKTAPEKTIVTAPKAKPIPEKPVAVVPKDAVPKPVAVKAAPIPVKPVTAAPKPAVAPAPKPVAVPKPAAVKVPAEKKDFFAGLAGMFGKKKEDKTAAVKDEDAKPKPAVVPNI